MIGGLLWRRRWFWGGLLGALAGCPIWATGMYFWQ